MKKKKSKRPAHLSRTEGSPPNRIPDAKSHQGPAAGTQAGVFSVLRWGLLAILTGWIVILHVFRLQHAGALWRDEISSLFVASADSWAKFYHAQSFDSFPLLNVFLMRLWLLCKGGTLAAVAANDGYLRMFGLLCGLFLLGALAWTSIRTFRSTPWLSFTLFALSPAVIQWGDSLRAYAVGSALAVLLFGQMWNLLQHPSTKQFCLCSALAVSMVWTLYGNAFFVLAICCAAAVVALSRKDWKLVGIVLGVGLVAALSLGLNYPVIRDMALSKDVVAQYITLTLILNSWWAAWAISGTWVGLLWLAAICCGVGLCLISLVQFKKPGSNGAHRELALYSMLALALGLLTFLFYLRTVDIPPQDWYFIPIGAVVVCILDALWPLLGNSRVLLPLQAILCVALAAACVNGTLGNLRQKMTNLDAMAHAMEQKVAGHDLILIPDRFEACTFVRYYHGPAKVQVWPPCKPEQLVVNGLNPILPATYATEDIMKPVYDEIAQTLRNGDKVWVVGDLVAVPLDRPPPRVPPGYNLEHQWRLGPFFYTWSAQAFHFLASHAKTGSIAEQPDVTQVNKWEAIRMILRFEGWKEGP